MHLASKIALEAVECEQRWIGDESTKATRAGAIDGRGVALRYLY